MTPDPDRLHQVFSGALELDGPAREAFLRDQCGEDPALLAEVRALLQQDAESSLLDEDRLDAMQRALAGLDRPVPDRIDEFTVEGELGRGGMGVVYRARQQSPSREVALKLLAPELVGSDVAGRFALEAEALGRLQHADIARIYAAGTWESEQGPRPYLAMELVDGAPLLTWARQSGASLRERIEVLIRVCDAVHHAHQKGLIHRDLKPGNILVTSENRPKVLDFGIARFVTPSPATPDFATRTGQVLGTLAYMSPEQADGQIDRIDVRTDVYALGVIGYQLLGGRLPLDVSGESVSTGLRRLLEEQPRPLGELDRRLRGDLQNIVATALRKEPERRYPSVQALADDLRRHLAHQPVQARRATAAYVVRRFARRHRGLVAGLSVAVAALIAGTALALQQASQARAAERVALAEADSMRRMSDFVRGLFQAAAPRVGRGQQVSARDIVLRGKEAVSEELGDAPMIRSRMERFLGGTLLDMGDYGGAEPLLRDAAQTLTESLGASDLRVLETRIAWARSLFRLGRLDAAETVCDEVLATMDANGIEEDPNVGAACYLCGILAGERRDFARAGVSLERAREVFSARDLPTPLRRVVVEMANSAQRQGDVDRADQLFQEALDIDPRGLDPLEAASIWTNLGNLRLSQRRMEEAETLFRRSLEVGERELGVDHPLLIRRLCNLAGVRGATGHLGEAAGLLERALELGEDGDPRYDDGVANAATNLGNVRAMGGDLDAAIELWQRAATIWERRAGAQSRDLADVLENMAIAHERLGRPDQANALRVRVAEIRGR